MWRDHGGVWAYEGGGVISLSWSVLVDPAFKSFPQQRPGWLILYGFFLSGFVRVGSFWVSFAFWPIGIRVYGGC